MHGQGPDCGEVTNYNQVSTKRHTAAWLCVWCCSIPWSWMQCNKGLGVVMAEGCAYRSLRFAVCACCCVLCFLCVTSQDHFLNAANWMWLSATAFFNQVCTPPPHICYIALPCLVAMLSEMLSGLAA